MRVASRSQARKNLSFRKVDTQLIAQMAKLLKIVVPKLGKPDFGSVFLRAPLLG